uniref:Uncharacterized protein n=1 Tax=Monopterus albus TaxID=43700 RepID=A0A3Q3QYX6_MONAL
MVCYYYVMEINFYFTVFVGKHHGKPYVCKSLFYLDVTLGKISCFYLTLKLLMTDPFLWFTYVYTQIPPGHFSKDPTMKQYVYLQAQFPDRLLEKVVLVSFQSGYIFIQTDKTLYTPSSRGESSIGWGFRGLEPVLAGQVVYSTSNKNKFQNIIFPLINAFRHAQNSENPGVWKLVAKFQSNPQQSYSAEFEVKEYGDTCFILYFICCYYILTIPVDGTAYVVFGITHEGQKRSLPRSLQTVSVSIGNGQVTLKKEHITETFPNILELVGGSIYVTVSVLTETGGEMVEATLRGIQIVTSPYTIHFKGTPKYFKPVMSFDVIEVVNPDETPASRIPVVVEPGPVNGLTVENGMAKLTINTEARILILTFLLDHTGIFNRIETVTFLMTLQVRKMTTVSWTAMKLYLAPSSQRVGCGRISNCLLALHTNRTGEPTKI